MNQSPEDYSSLRKLRSFLIRSPLTLYPLVKKKSRSLTSKPVKQLTVNARHAKARPDATHYRSTSQLRRPRPLLLVGKTDPHRSVIVFIKLVIIRSTLEITLSWNPRRLFATTMNWMQTTAHVSQTDYTVILSYFLRSNLLKSWSRS